MSSGFTGLWFDCRATMRRCFFGGYNVSVYQTGAYETSNIITTRERHQVTIHFKSKFRAMLYRARINKQQRPTIPEGVG